MTKIKSYTLPGLSPLPPFSLHWVFSVLPEEIAGTFGCCQCCRVRRCGTLRLRNRVREWVDESGGRKGNWFPLCPPPAHRLINATTVWRAPGEMCVCALAPVYLTLCAWVRICECVCVFVLPSVWEEMGKLYVKGSEDPFFNFCLKWHTQI